MASAAFSINGDAGSGGYEAANGEVLTLQLLAQPPIGVSTVLFQVYDPEGFDPALGIAANPPRASKGAPLLTLEGASEGPAVSPSSVDGSVTVEMPSTGAHSYIVRCVVNGGLRVVGGRVVPDPSLIVERGVWIPAPSGARKVVVTETTQFEPDGWAGALAALVDASRGSMQPFSLVYAYSEERAQQPWRFGTGYVSFGNVLGYERTDAHGYGFWFRTTSSTAGYVFHKQNVAANRHGPAVFIDGTGQVAYHLNNTTPGSNDMATRTTAAFNDGAWHHCLIAYVGAGAGSVSFWIDGGATAKTVVEDLLSTTIVNTSPLLIGSDNAGFPFVGDLRDLAQWTVAPTADDAAAIHAAGIGADYSTLDLSALPVQLVRMDELDTVGAGGISDEGSGNTDGTATGLTPTVPERGTVSLDDSDEQSSSTSLYIDPVDAEGVNWSVFLDALSSGFVRIASTDGSDWLVFEVYRATERASYYYELDVTPVAASSDAPFSDEQPVRLTFDVTETGRPSVTPSIGDGSTQEQLDAVIAALVSHGLVTDDRVP